MDGTTAPTDPVPPDGATKSDWRDSAISGLIEDVRALAEQVQGIVTNTSTSAKTADLAARVGGIQQSPEIGALAAALAAAQAEMHNPGLNREAKVELKTGGGYRHRFADLPEILGTVRPVLGKHGVSFVQMPTLISSGTFLVTRLMHSSGQWLQIALPLPSVTGGRIQEWGGALTFLKRYQISALLGVAGAEEDDDGNAWDGNQAQITDRNGVSTAPPPRQPRGAGAAARKAADEAERAQPQNQPGDPGPGEPEPGGPPPNAQTVLREFSKSLKAFFDPKTGEIDIPGAETAWINASQHMVGVPEHTLDTLVDRYRGTFRRDPPLVEGLSYKPVPETANA